MITRVVVDEEKMVNSVANLKVDVSNWFVNIVDIFIADIVYMVANDRLPT